MANFWDLPRTVRDQIYRLHLVKGDIEDSATHKQTASHCVSSSRGVTKYMPPICEVSARADAEAAPIYYGENHFVFRTTWIWGFNYFTYNRHVRLIKNVTIDWAPYGAHEAFLVVAKMEEP